MSAYQWGTSRAEVFVRFMTEIAAFGFLRFFLDLIFFSVIAMAMSLGKRSWRTKAWIVVAASRAITVNAETADSPQERDLVNTFVTFAVYLMVAIEAPVIGKVYAHHAKENLLNQEM